MRIELEGNFLSCLKFITETFWEVNIKTDKEGIHIAEQIEGGFYGIVFDYKIKGLKDEVFRFDCDKLNKILKQVKKDKAFIEFDKDETIRVFLEGKDFKRDFMLPKIVPNEEDTRIRQAKDFEGEILLEVMTERIADICSEASIFAKDKGFTTITFATKTGNEIMDIVSISNDVQLYHATMDLPFKASKNIDVHYTLANLERLADMPSLTLSLRFGTDFPMTASIEEDNFEMCFIVAPLVFVK
jgi:hypothetical protein